MNLLFFFFFSLSLSLLLSVGVVLLHDVLTSHDMLLPIVQEYNIEGEASHVALDSESGVCCCACCCVYCCADCCLCCCLLLCVLLCVLLCACLFGFPAF